MKGEIYLQLKTGKSKRKPVTVFLKSLIILPLTSRDIKKATSIYAKLKVKGLIVNDIDILLSAQALNRNLIIVTKDKDFETIKKVERKLKIQII